MKHNKEHVRDEAKSRAGWVRRRGECPSEDLVLRECDVSVRLSRGAALITRWLDAES